MLNLAANRWGLIFALVRRLQWFTSAWLIQRPNSFILVTMIKLQAIHRKSGCLAMLTLLIAVASGVAGDRMIINSEGLIVFFDQSTSKPKLFWAGSGKFFINDDGLITTMDPETRGLVVGDDVIEAARLAKECRSATTDIEGNWGRVMDGLQMSIRFETNSFSPQQPVRALVILRNVTNEMRYYSLVRPGDALLHLHAVDRNGDSVRRKESTDSIGCFRIFVRPGTQRRETVDLRDSFDVTKEGEFEAWAVRYILDEKAESDIVTGKTRPLTPDPKRTSTNSVVSSRARFIIKR